MKAKSPALTFGDYEHFSTLHYQQTKILHYKSLKNLFC